MIRVACALLVCLMLTGCTPKSEEELDHPPLVILPEIPVEPVHGDPMEIVFVTTPRGMEVEAHRYMIERRDLWLVAVEEIDRVAGPWVQGWMIRVTQPEGLRKVDKESRRIYVRWRLDGEKPTWVMLPGLEALVRQATAR
jgi:hypothetical protein